MATHSSRIRTIGVHEQLAMMGIEHPKFRCSIRSGLLVCRGGITPTEVNRTYRVRVEYRAPTAPQSFVEEPPLRRRRPEEPIPHTYDSDRPCLYLPGGNEWRSDKRIAHTIVPWLSEWLFYYEVWRVTGEWLGGGVHPARPQRPTPSKKGPA